MPLYLPSITGGGGEQYTMMYSSGLASTDLAENVSGLGSVTYGVEAYANSGATAYNHAAIYRNTNINFSEFDWTWASLVSFNLTVQYNYFTFGMGNYSITANEIGIYSRHLVGFRFGMSGSATIEASQAYVNAGGTPTFAEITAPSNGLHLYTIQKIGSDFTFKIDDGTPVTISGVSPTNLTRAGLWGVANNGNASNAQLGLMGYNILMK